MLTFIPERSNRCNLGQLDTRNLILSAESPCQPVSVRPLISPQQDAILSSTLGIPSNSQPPG